MNSIPSKVVGKLKIWANSSKSPRRFFHHCPGCSYYIRKFNPLPTKYFEQSAQFGFPFNFREVETLNVDQYTCIVCGMNDRDRLYTLYLRKAIQQDKTYNLVEFAPSSSLSAFIRRHKNIKHRTADLFMENVDDKNVDLQQLDIYSDNSFDIFICSHILEHVNDDRKAMRELYRVLKPGGFGIAMVPLFLGVTTTDEDPSITDIPTRWKRFGQDDHIRLYARKDYIARLEEAGFKVDQLGMDYFGKEEFEKHGIDPRSILYIVRK